MISNVQQALPTWQKVTRGTPQLLGKSQDEAAQAGVQRIISFARQDCSLSWLRRKRNRDGREGKEKRKEEEGREEEAGEEARGGELREGKDQGRPQTAMEFIYSLNSILQGGHNCGQITDGKTLI